MEIEVGKIYIFKSSSPVRQRFWGRKVKILETGCDLMYNATIKAELLDNNIKVDCYNHDFVPIKNNIIKI